MFKCYFLNSFAEVSDHFSIPLAVFRGGLQISPSRMSQVYGELPPWTYCIVAGR